MNEFHESPWADRNLTTGVVRILERVTEARCEEVSCSLFQLLLHELFIDENQASTLISLSDESIASILNDAQWPIEQEAASEREWQMTLLRHADRIAIEHSEEGVTGTEHLLLAAIGLSPAIHKFLVEQGVEPESLAGQLETPENTLEIEVKEEFQIRPVQIGAVDEATLFRVLDASSNRCREGIRVVEDYVRFALNDRLLSKSLKSLRHDLTTVLNYLGQSQWVSCRDTIRDVGTQETLGSETRRETSLDVLRANLKRTEESLRTIEEFSKQLNPEWSQQLEQIRYRFYTIEKAVETCVHSRIRLADARLYLLVTSESCRYGLEQTVRNTITAGVDVVQLREKSWPDRKLIDLAAQVRSWTAEHNTLFIVNDRPDIAVAVGADGVHLGQDDMSVAEARQIVGSRVLIGVSTHSLEQARTAIFDGADYLGVGPTFSSQTKEFTDFPGLDFVSAMARETSIPWFAIGGIDEDRLPLVLQEGASRVAVSNVICNAPHPRGVARKFATELASKSSISSEM
ncbi:thiamine phosphate synthase [Thalassoglobus sp. JC818]|uniref:thiamine phosphate synthase n=1 Tax=Thalassoglobus sp. JC818 TaxID=3232136 RepID=UPI003458EC47